MLEPPLPLGLALRQPLLPLCLRSCPSASLPLRCGRHAPAFPLPPCDFHSASSSGVLRARAALWLPARSSRNSGSGLCQPHILHPLGMLLWGAPLTGGRDAVCDALPWLWRFHRLSPARSHGWALHGHRVRTAQDVEAVWLQRLRAALCCTSSRASSSLSGGRSSTSTRKAFHPCSLDALVQQPAPPVALGACGATHPCARDMRSLSFSFSVCPTYPSPVTVLTSLYIHPRLSFADLGERRQAAGAPPPSQILAPSLLASTRSLYVTRSTLVRVSLSQMGEISA